MQPFNKVDFDQKPNFKPNMVDEHEQKIKMGGQVEEIPQEQYEEGDNPFDMMKYQQFQKTPDNFIQPGSSMVESLLTDEGVPEDIKKKYWYVFHRDNILTFLDQNRKTSKLLNIDIMKIDLLNCCPYYDYTFETESEMNVIRNIYETKLDRALGTTGNIKNERTTLQSQFSEVKQINEVNQSESSSGSFFKKLLGRR